MPRLELFWQKSARKGSMSTMRKSLQRFGLGVLAILFLGTPKISGAQQRETLESSALRLELNERPYYYRVIERATGDVLVSQSGGTSFRNIAYGVKSASEVMKSADSMRATLRLTETQDTAQVRFTFVKPEILQVLLTFKDTPPAE